MHDPAPKGYATAARPGKVSSVLSALPIVPSSSQWAMGSSPDWDATCSVVEESGAKNYVDSSSKTVSESTLGGSEDDADVIAATDIPAVDSSKPSGNNNRGGGRGGRGKKPRHKNWMKRENGKGDNNMNNNSGKQQQQQMPSVSTTVVDS